MNKTLSQSDVKVLRDALEHARRGHAGGSYDNGIYDNALAILDAQEAAQGVGDNECKYCGANTRTEHDPNCGVYNTTSATEDGNTLPLIEEPYNFLQLDPPGLAVKTWLATLSNASGKFQFIGEGDTPRQAVLNAMKQIGG